MKRSSFFVSVFSQKLKSDYVVTWLRVVSSVGDQVETVRDC